LGCDFRASGATENSPVFQRRVKFGIAKVPQGRLTLLKKHRIEYDERYGICGNEFQPSLRDSFFCAENPALKRRAIFGHRCAVLNTESGESSARWNSSFSLSASCISNMLKRELQLSRHRQNLRPQLADELVRQPLVK
jgi:hypothetical protein